MNSLILKLKAYKSFFIVYVPVASIVFVTAFLMLVYPHTAADGIRNGLSLCLETVIPSLFPFMFAVTLIYDIGCFSFFAVGGEKITSLLFRLPGVALPIMLMSFTGGFPVGASLIEKAYEDGKLTSSQACRMLLFCVNPGPAFTVSVIGSSIIGSVRAGAVIYFSVTASSLILALISRFFAEDEIVISRKNEVRIPSVNASLLTDVITKCTVSMAGICVCILVFCCISSLLQVLIPDGDFCMFFSMLSEVTNGAVVASDNFSLPAVSAITSFAGFCVHFQVLPVIIKLRLKYRIFLAVRIISAALSGVITAFLSSVLPQYCSVVSLGIKPETASLDVSLPVCVWLMVMCGLFLVGDNYVVSKKLLKNKA